MTAARAVLERTYAAFNARDIDAVLAVMHPDVDWPNGMDGGRVLGHAAGRAYWTRQWALIDPRVAPIGFTVEADGRVAVAVHQVRWYAIWPARSSRTPWSSTSTLFRTA